MTEESLVELVGVKTFRGTAGKGIARQHQGQVLRLRRFKKYAQDNNSGRMVPEKVTFIKSVCGQGNDRSDSEDS